jgi:hypothetical protein
MRTFTLLGLSALLAIGCGDIKDLTDDVVADADADDTGAGTDADDTGIIGDIDADADDTGAGTAADDTGDTGSTDTGEPVAPDVDGDGISDEDEGSGEIDTDGDGTPDSDDDDSDGDGIPDGEEGSGDTDGDGIGDWIDTDSDGDGIDDEVEGSGDTDGDGMGDWVDTDSDGDGIDDEVEGSGDTDDDGAGDWIDTDSDDDGIDDEDEGAEDTDGDGDSDHTDTDSDGDGIGDADEGFGDDGELADTDGDGIPDFRDTDSDGDSLSDEDESTEHGTDPYDDDTDGDGASDGVEVTVGTDPVDPSDVPGDLDVHLLAFGETLDVSFPLESEVQEVDVGFLLDTTGSMGGTATAMAAEFGEIVTELEASSVDDGQYGYATYDDYAYGSFGYSSSGDRPFDLRHQVSDDVDSVQTAFSSWDLHYGGDGPESGMEGLYQGLTGAGYDQNCDGVYETTTDVMPFLSSVGDPFSGSGGEFYSAGISGGGERGGFGFRKDSLAVVIYATDNYLRDPDDGYGSPMGCPLDAGSPDVITAAEAIGVRLIGVAVNGTTASPQIEALAIGTGSLYDADGTGVVDDPLGFAWSGTSASFRTTIVGAIEGLLDSVTFSEVTLEVEGDVWGFVTAVDPTSYTDVTVGSDGLTLDFTVTIEGVVPAMSDDQIFTMDLNIMGDGTTLLGTQPLIIVVPGV